MGSPETYGDRKVCLDREQGSIRDVHYEPSVLGQHLNLPSRIMQPKMDANVLYESALPLFQYHRTHSLGLAARRYAKA